MLTTDDFKWCVETKELTSTLDDIKNHKTFSYGRDPKKGFLVRSSKTDRVLLFKIQDEVRDQDGNVQYWAFLSDNSQVKVILFT